MRRPPAALRLAAAALLLGLGAIATTACAFAVGGELALAVAVGSCTLAAALVAARLAVLGDRGF